MALVLPLLLLIIVGIIDFGFLFRELSVVTNAAREGARAGVLPEYGADQNVVDRVQQYLDASGIAVTCAIGDRDCHGERAGRSIATRRPAHSRRGTSASPSFTISVFLAPSPHSSAARSPAFR